MCVEQHASQFTRVSKYMYVHQLVCKKWSVCVELCVASTHLIYSVYLYIYIYIYIYIYHISEAFYTRSMNM